MAANGINLSVSLVTNDSDIYSQFSLIVNSSI
jgi:hypothetical protein